MRTFLTAIALAFGTFFLFATPAAAQYGCPPNAICNQIVNNNTQMGNGYFLPVVPQHQQPFLPPHQQPRPHHGRGYDGNDLRDSAGMIAGAIIVGAIIDRSQQPQFDPRMYQQRQNCCAQQQGGNYGQQQQFVQQQTVTTVSHAVTICGETPAGFNCQLSQGDTRYCGQLAANLGCATLVNASNGQPVRRSQVVRLY